MNTAATTDPEILIAWLRGINVGGHRKIKMADLRELVTELGAQDVATYIQSGNLLFRPAGTLAAAGGEEAIEQLISQAIENRFGFDVPVMIRSIDEVAEARKAIGTRFADVLAESEEAEKMVHVLFLSDVPSPEAT